MGNLLDNFGNKYNGKWWPGLQQDASKLMGMVQTDFDAYGQSVFYDALETVEATEVTERFALSKPKEASGRRRQMFPRKWSDEGIWDDWDEENLKPLDKPVALYQQNQRKAFFRAHDRVIVEGLLGDVNEVYGGKSRKCVIPSSNVIPVDYVMSGSAVRSGLTVAKIAEAVSVLEEANCWHEGAKSESNRLVFIGSPRQKKELMLSVEASSVDFVDVKALVEGKVDEFMGIKFVWSNYLPLSAGKDRTCLLYNVAAAQFGMWRNARFDTYKDDSRGGALVARAKMSNGCIRLMDEAFVQVLCGERA